MSWSRPTGGAVRPASVVNTAIRAFLCARMGRSLRPEERRVYEALRAEWLKAEEQDRSQVRDHDRVIA